MYESPFDNEPSLLCFATGLVVGALIVKCVDDE